MEGGIPIFIPDNEMLEIHEKLHCNFQYVEDVPLSCHLCFSLLQNTNFTILR